MNINLILNSENLPFLNQLNKYKETEKSVKEMEKSVKETEKSVKETKKVEDYSNITYSFNLGDKDIISNNFLLKDDNIINYSSYINLLKYMNKNKNSKVIFYYDKKYENKLSYTKKILTFLNMQQKFEEIHNLIENIHIHLNYLKSFKNWEIPKDLESYFDAEGKLNNSYFKKVNEFKKYFNEEGEIILNDVEEFEEIEFIELPDISTNQEDYIIFFLLKKLSEMYENIPILFTKSFDQLTNFKIEKENDLIFKNIPRPNIFFKNIKKIDEILNFINENTNININDILNQFYELKKENNFTLYYNYKN